MRFGLSVSISRVVLLGFSWAAKLREEEGEGREVGRVGGRVCLCFVYKSVYAYADEG